MANGSFTANSQDSVNNGTNKGRVFGNFVDAIISGTFTATVQLQTKTVDQNGAVIWAPVGTDITAAAVRYVEAALTDREWRLVVTAFTSGTIVWELNAMKDSARRPSQPA